MSKTKAPIVKCNKAAQKIILNSNINFKSHLNKETTNTGYETTNSAHITEINTTTSDVTSQYLDFSSTDLQQSKIK